MTSPATTPTFSAQLLGQTEKACNAILDRLLAGSGLTEPQWVTLTLTVAGRGSLDRGGLTDRVADALKVGDADAHARIAELAALQLLEPVEGGGIEVTDAGQALWTEIRTATTRVTAELWGDLPAGDLATAGRVLSTVLARANTMLAAGV
jgi:DNA-binding MarR family transcriptional regulator